MATTQDWKQEDFPCTLTLTIPFPTLHLASTAHRTLTVDAELSPLVRRSFTLSTPSQSSSPQTSPESQASLSSQAQRPAETQQDASVLVVNYAATTNRMLRVAVNGFIESVGVVLGVMRELDVDVVYEKTTEGLDGVQGLDGVRV